MSEASQIATQHQTQRCRRTAGRGVEVILGRFSTYVRIQSSTISSLKRHAQAHVEFCTWGNSFYYGDLLFNFPAPFMLPSFIIHHSLITLFCAHKNEMHHSFCIVLLCLVMSSAKKILITGSTDGIGLETAKKLIQQGHTVLLHGRSSKKLAATFQQLKEFQQSNDQIETYRADLSKMEEVTNMAKKVTEKHSQIDVLINNAGVFKTPNTKTESGLDIRFVVNTIAPYLLTKQLLPIIPTTTGRIINLSSAAQAPVNFRAWSDVTKNYSDFDAYAQSKLAIIMWSNHLAATLKESPIIVSINPASMLGTKMVREAFGQPGKDVGIGVRILVQAALGDEFANASGKYYDNDNQRFAEPGSDALNPSKNAQLVEEMERILQQELEKCSS
jgi:NAD(P)-dependent dehydrogenase (short-subunit alcohol dehydrogenase family)